ncbi:MAG TPA: threonylcarbamoyl-AMP synthase [Desulfobacteraceae bacterium]|nr:threonylcarbamoyl-AMP synthase [Desulfobacteraceae bacterium]
MKGPLIIEIEKGEISEDKLLAAKEAILSGKVIAYPTETFYALGVNALDGSAIERLYWIKERPKDRPIPVIIDSLSSLNRYVREIPKEGEILIERFWPGPLTIIFYASYLIPSILVSNTQKIGIRISSNPICKRLAELCKVPITATSANISGERECRDARDVLEVFGDRVDLIIRGERATALRPSTIVDITVSPPKILREGMIERYRIQDAIGIEDPSK